MKNIKNGNASYQHSLEEVVRYVKDYLPHGVQKEIAEQLAKKRGLSVISATQYVSAVKRGLKVDAEIMDMLISECEKVTKRIGKQAERIRELQTI